MKPASEPSIILFAEDDADDRFLIREAFSSAKIGARLYFVQDSEQLFDCLYHRNEFSDALASPRPDIIFVDLSLPGLNGAEVAGIIKADPELRDIPLVILSATDDIQDFLPPQNISAASNEQNLALLSCIDLVTKAVRKFGLPIQALP